MKGHAAYRQLVVYITILFASGLGGVAPVDGSGSPQSGVSQSKVSLAIAFKDRSMKLIGTVVSGSRQDSVVIFADERDWRQWLLWEGDQLGSTTIKHIQSDSVIVATDNGDFEVKLRRNILNASLYSAATSQGSSQPPKPFKKGSRHRLYSLDQKKVESTFTDIGSTKQSITANPGRLFNQDKGVRITSIKTGSVFADMGLRRGDLVLRVNNMEVDDSSDLTSLITNMQTDGKASLTVRRRARTYNFSLGIQ